MNNSSVLPNDKIQETSASSDNSMYIWWSVLSLVVVGLLFFIYFVAVMLRAFFTTPELQQNARYILFVYLLVNDLLYVVVAFIMALAAMYTVYIPVPVCYILYTLSAMSFRVTPLNLAAMALEQYVAICYPLQHAQLCRPQRANLAFAMICSALLIPYVAELGVMISSDIHFFYLYVICKQEMLLINPLQNTIRSINLFLNFPMVGLVFIFTYVKIMLVALKIRSKKSSATKAGKTVMLHAFQFLLSIVSLVSNLTKSFFSHGKYYSMANFIAFTCVPRFLTPIIYGVRDELLRKYLRKSLPNAAFRMKVFLSAHQKSHGTTDKLGTSEKAIS